MPPRRTSAPSNCIFPRKCSERPISHISPKWRMASRSALASARAGHSRDHQILGLPRSAEQPAATLACSQCPDLLSQKHRRRALVYPFAKQAEHRLHRTIGTKAIVRGMYPASSESHSINSDGRASFLDPSSPGSTASRCRRQPQRKSRRSRARACGMCARSSMPTTSTVIRLWPSARSGSSKGEQNSPTERPTGRVPSPHKQEKVKQNEVAGGLGFEPRLTESECAK